MASPTVAARPIESGFEVVFIDEAGDERRLPLSSSWNVAFERAAAVRSFPSFKGQKNFPGLWWAATTGQHIAYKSWAKRDVVMMMDFDPQIVAFAAQPFWLVWPEDDRIRRHAPDYFARTVDGEGVVVDGRSSDRGKAKSAQPCAVTIQACREVGWRFRRADSPAPVLEGR